MPLDNGERSSDPSTVDVPLSHPSPPFGLENPDLRCFIHAVVQALHRCTAYRYEVINHVLQAAQQKTGAEPFQGHDTLFELARLFARMTMAPTRDCSVLSTDDLASSFPFHPIRHQQDAAEFLECHIRPLASNSLTTAFKFRATDIASCDHCQNRSDGNPSDSMILRLTIPTDTAASVDRDANPRVRCSLQPLVDCAFGTYAAEEIECFKCSQCNATRGSHRTVLQNPPPYLLLQLPLFFGNGSKSKRLITLDQPTLKIQIPFADEYALPTPTVQLKSYSLIAAIIHQGTDMYHGHYYTLVKHVSAADCWFECNDATVTWMNAEQVLNALRGENDPSPDHCPFMLVYEKDGGPQLPIAPCLKDLEHRRTESQLPKALDVGPHPAMSPLANVRIKVDADSAIIPTEATSSAAKKLRRSEAEVSQESDKIVGLGNVGNSCAMNAVLQILVRCRYFCTEAINGSSILGKILKEITKPSQTSISSANKEEYVRESSKNVSAATVDLEIFLQVLPKSVYDSKQLHDAAQFLRDIIETDFVKPIFRKWFSWVTEKACVCKYGASCPKQITESYTWHFVVPHAAVRTKKLSHELLQVLQTFMTPCPHCGGGRPGLGWKVTLPRYWVIEVDPPLEKNDSPGAALEGCAPTTGRDYVEIDCQLDLSMPTTWKTDDGCTQQIRYNLIAVVVHVGPTLLSGHYVALVECNGRWVLCNDAEIIMYKHTREECVQLRVAAVLRKKWKDTPRLLVYERGISAHPTPPNPSQAEMPTLINADLRSASAFGTKEDSSVSPTLANIIQKTDAGSKRSAAPAKNAPEESGEPCVPGRGHEAPS